MSNNNNLPMFLQKYTHHKKKSVLIFVEPLVFFPSKQILQSFFPDVNILYHVLQDDWTSDMIETIIQEQHVKRIMTNTISSSLEKLFFPVMQNNPKKILISTVSTLPSTRQNAPANIWFVLSTDDQFLARAFTTIFTPSTQRYLVVNPTDPYLVYIQQFATLLGIPTTTTENMKHVQAELVKTDVLYISVLDETTQKTTMQNIPQAFRGTVSFIDQPPLSYDVVLSCPQALNIVCYSPGTGPNLYETHPFILATKQQFSSYPISSIVIVFYLLTFLCQWDVFINRQLVTRDNVNFQYSLIFYFHKQTK